MLLWVGVNRGHACPWINYHYDVSSSSNLHNFIKTPCLPLIPIGIPIFSWHNCFHTILDPDLIYHVDFIFGCSVVILTGYRSIVRMTNVINGTGIQLYSVFTQSVHLVQWPTVLQDMKLYASPGLNALFTRCTIILLKYGWFAQFYSFWHPV